jgi:hypothetical protein
MSAGPYTLRSSSSDVRTNTVLARTPPSAHHACYPPPPLGSTDFLLNLLANLRALKRDHYIILSTQRLCLRLQRRHCEFSCVWSSLWENHPGLPGWGLLKGDMFLMWAQQWRYIASALELGYRVLRADTDVYLAEDPYPILWSPMLAPFEMVRRERRLCRPPPPTHPGCSAAQGVQHDFASTLLPPRYCPAHRPHVQQDVVRPPPLYFPTGGAAGLCLDVGEQHTTSVRPARASPHSVTRRARAADVRAAETAPRAAQHWTRLFASLTGRCRRIPLGGGKRAEALPALLSSGHVYSFSAPAACARSPTVNLSPWPLHTFPPPPRTPPSMPAPLTALIALSPSPSPQAASTL